MLDHDTRQCAIRSEREDAIDATYITADRDRAGTEEPESLSGGVHGYRSRSLSRIIMQYHCPDICAHTAEREYRLDSGYGSSDGYRSCIYSQELRGVKHIGFGIFKISIIAKQCSVCIFTVFIE